jgi:hypothetical protein
MNQNAVNSLRNAKRHILISDVDKFNSYLLYYILNVIYGTHDHIKLNTIRERLERELKWSLDEHIPDKDVIREWLDNDYPPICITELSFDSCIKLANDFPDYEIVVYSWMKHEGNLPF